MRNSCQLTIAIIVALWASTAGATAQRTFVSSTGNDGNPCSVGSPCRSFAAAIAQTTAGGDIVVLDSAGYGPVAITKSVAITAPAGVFAGITVFSGAGVDIATAGLSVMLRGLTITGIGGNVGVHLGAASDVTIERCDIAKMLDYGIRADTPGASLHITDTSVQGSASGVSLTGAVTTEIVRSSVHGNAGDGIAVFNGAKATIHDSDVSRNGNGINATSASGSSVTTRLTLEGVVVSFNSGEGVWLYTTGGNTVWASIGRSAFADNGARGIRVESSMPPDFTFAFIADSRFSGNQFAGVQFTGISGVASGYLARNAFAEAANGVAIGGVGQYSSGGGNIANIYSPPAGTASF